MLHYHFFLIDTFSIYLLLYCVLELFQMAQVMRNFTRVRIQFPVENHVEMSLTLFETFIHIPPIFLKKYSLKVNILFL